MSNARIQDVAAHAGVSLATITRVVNNREYVAPQTRERVQQSIKALGYVPNRMAKALKNSRTGIIGNVMPLVVGSIVNSMISQSLRNTAASYGLLVLPMYAEPDPAREEHLLQELIGRMVEGIIFTNTAWAGRNTIKAVISNNIPVIMVERPLDVTGVDKVVWDNIAGSTIAASHFFSQGHRSAGFIGRQLGAERDEKDRLEGFVGYYQKAGIKLRGKNIRLVPEYDIEHGYRAMKDIIAQGSKNRPTGCYITSDTLLCGALQCLYEAGIRVPEDLSIISHDNTYSAMCSPPITTVAIPYEEIGKTAISMFWERRQQNRHYDKTVTLSPFLVDRNSVLPLKP
ncbi:MAG: LacI family transcriptional regulator [Treponema sp.]|jgi:LacI family transcriptional regulator|nr:LacI family transcriptional regulator [Treponema sp.]